MTKQKLPVRLTIPATKRTSIPQKFVFVDTETRPRRVTGKMFKHELILGCAVYWQREKGRHKEREERRDFHSALEFWEWVTEHVHSRETVHVFAHNLTFDFLVLDGFQVLPSLGYTMQSVYNKVTTTVLRFAKDKRHLVIADTMNYFPVKLDKVAASMGIERVELPFDIGDREQLQARCRSDAEIIYRAVRALVDKLIADGLGRFAVTAPSLAHGIFRHRFMKHNIVTSHNQDVVAFEKDAYTGGYINVGKLLEGGKENLYKLDVNSMYPSVMRSQSYPTQLLEFSEHVSDRVLEMFLRSYSVIADVTVHTDQARYPLRTVQGVIYPLGDFRTKLTTPLLKDALDHDRVVEVHKIAVYNQAPVFREYIDYMYANRVQAQERGDRADETFYKTMANSLYGKFGQAATESRIVGASDPGEFAVYLASAPDTGETWREVHAGGSVVFIYEVGESRYTFYGIAAHVTDFARAKLFQIIDLCGTENVFYSDTDSVIVNEEGKARAQALISDGTLGALKVEDQGEVFVGFAKKDYVLGEERKLKGVSDVMYAEEAHVFQALQNVSIMGTIKKDLRGGAYWRESTKRHNPFLTATWIEKNGLTVPVRLPDEAEAIGRKAYTLEHIRALATYLLTPKQKALVQGWVG